MSKKVLLLAAAILGSWAVPSIASAHDPCTCTVPNHRHGKPNCRPATRVPELSGRAAGASLALVAGGLLVLAGRRRRDSDK